MNPFLLPPAERLADWKQFRMSLANLPDKERLAEVASYWSQAPLLTIAYDLEDCEHWPTIWEMVYANQWCRNTVAIGMEATLRLGGMTPERLILRLIHDRSIQSIILILVVDDHWVLNYDWGSFRLYPESDHYNISAWRYTGKRYTRLD